MLKAFASNVLSFADSDMSGQALVTTNCEHKQALDEIS